MTQQSHKFKIHTNKILFGILLGIVCLVPNKSFSKKCGAGHFLKAYYESGDCVEDACKNKEKFNNNYRQYLTDDLKNIDWEYLICPGGEYVSGYPYVQGVENCNDGQHKAKENDHKCGDLGDSAIRTCEKTSDAKQCTQYSFTCKPGYYYSRDNDGCTGCPKKDRAYNYYCPGVKNLYKTNKNDRDQKLLICKENEIPNKKFTGCCSCPSGMKANTKKDGNYEAYTICTDGTKTWPTNGNDLDSECKSAASSTDSSYTYSGCFDGEIQDGYMGCAVGNFYNGKQCCPCTDANLITIAKELKWNNKDATGLACPEKCWNKKGDTEHWGTCVHSCKSGEQANSNHTACGDGAVYDIPTFNYDIPSFNFVVSRPSCLPGQVAFNGACVACTSNQDWIEYAQTKNVYCPGVNTWPDNTAPVLKQIEKCPKMMRPNYDLSDCECIWGDKSSDGTKCENVKLSKEDLKCGPAGCNAPIYKQCWTKKKTKSYMKCMGFD